MHRPTNGIQGLFSSPYLLPEKYMAAITGLARYSPTEMTVQTIRTTACLPQRRSVAADSFCLGRNDSQTATPRNVAANRSQYA